MEKNQIDNSDKFKGFVTPKVTTRASKSSNLAYSDTESETENINDKEIEISPRRGRSAGAGHGLSNQYIPHSINSRRSSSKIVMSKNEEPQKTKRITRNSYSSSESESDLMTSKRIKINSNTSSQLDSNESERASDSDQSLTLYISEGASPAFKKKKRNKIQRSGNENSNDPPVPEITTTDERLLNRKKASPQKRRSRAPKKSIVQNTLQSAIVLRQNGKGVLVRIDNTEAAVNVERSSKTHQKGVVHTASVTPTNAWNTSQMLELNNQDQSAVPTEISPVSDQHVLIVNNRLFKFDAVIPKEIQDLSDEIYVHSSGEGVRKERLVANDPGVEFEKMSTLPMKISSFVSLYGTYFGHKNLAGNSGKKVKRKSLVDTNISNSFYVFCRICSKLRACTGGSYNNFIRHLQDAHSLVDPRKMNLGVLSLNEKGEVLHGHSEKYKWDNPRQAVGLDLLLQYIMDSNLPFTNIERFSLKRLLNFFDPQLVLPSSKTLHALLSTRVETEVVTSLNKTLKSVKSATLVVDAWSSRSIQGVLAVSLVFLDNNFEWKQKTICIGRITGSHTAFNIGEKIKSAISRWNLDGKIRFVVSDGGSNMVKCLADLHEEALQKELGSADTSEASLERSIDVSLDLSENAPSLDEDFTLRSASNRIDARQQAQTEGSNDIVFVQDSPTGGFDNTFCITGDDNIETLIHKDSDLLKTIELSKLDDFLYSENLKPSKCLAHTLQRVLADGINRNAKAMKIHKQIKKIAAFGRKRQVVREVTKALLGRVVIRPGLTRWNSVVDSGWTLIEPAMFNIMRCLIDDARGKVGAKMRERLPDPLTDEFAIDLKEFLMVSDPICKLTDELQANGITAHLVIPGIARTYEAIKMTQIELMQDYQQIILRSFESKIVQFVNDENFILATVLCPYYKYHFFEVYFEEQPSNALQLPSLDFVKELCFTHLQTADEMEASFNSERSQPSSTLSTNCSYAQKIQEREKKRLESIDNKTSDLKKYIGEKVSGESPKDYWQRKKSDFPRLYEKAREILCKPATSGLVERLFSLIADINTPDRVNLHVKTLEEIIMYKEFINVPRTYKKATEDIFNATDEQLVELVKNLSVQNNVKNKENDSAGSKKSRIYKRSSRNAPSISVTDD